jgi:hypothetical protein
MTQLALIDDAGAAIAARDAGMQRATDHAKADRPGWTQEARDFLRRYAEQHAEFAAFMVVGASELDEEFPQPDCQKAWGQVFKSACKAGIIEDSNKTVKHPRRHCSKATVWKSLVAS